MNFESLTLGEVAKVEELSGQPIGALGDEKAPKGKVLAAVTYVMRRREDKNVTFNEVLDMTFQEVSEFLGLDEEESESDPLG